MPLGHLIVIVVGVTIKSSHCVHYISTSNSSGYEFLRAYHEFNLTVAETGASLGAIGHQADEGRRRRCRVLDVDVRVDGVVVFGNGLRHVQRPGVAMVAPPLQRLPSVGVRIELSAGGQRRLHPVDDLLADHVADVAVKNKIIQLIIT